MKIIDTQKRSILKTISWRVISFIITFLVAFLWTRDLAIATGVGIVANLINALAFYLHERGWSYIRFGQKRIPNQGFTLWFTGLPASGKNTLANEVSKELSEKYILPVERLDGRVLRQTLWQDLGFSSEDRYKNIERATYIAKLLTKNRVVTVASFVSPEKGMRSWARKQIGNFVEIYTKCPVEVCIQRDPRGEYKKALAGQITQFPGISTPYEEPDNPEIVLETDKENIEQCRQKIIEFLKKSGYLD